MMHELQLELPGRMLAARVWGDKALPPLLALHGWLDNAASFQRLAPLLAPHYRVIALDLPGHGRSSHLPPGSHYHYHWVDYIQAVLAAAQALGLAHFRLLGHSLGAGIASLVAAAIGERVERLALIEGLGPIADAGERTLERYQRAVKQRENAAERQLRLFPDIDAALAVRAAASGMDAELARPIVERGVLAVNGGYRWSSDPRLTLSSAVLLAESQLRDLLAGIVSPSLLLLAQPETAYLPAALMQARATRVMNLRVEHLNGGHHLHLQHPQAVAQRLLPFLA